MEEEILLLKKKKNALQLKKLKYEGSYKILKKGIERCSLEKEKKKQPFLGKSIKA